MAKTVLITGASSGIGAAAAALFAANNYNVAVNYCNHKQSALNVVNDILSAGGSAAAFGADVSSYVDAKALTDDVTAFFGKIDVLINNAGIAQQILFTDITPTMWDKMINTNLSSVYNCCKHVLPQMIHRKDGRIINVSSMWGQTGGSCEVHYSAAKAGVIGLTKALAKETAPSGITVNCVCPGVIKTNMTSCFSSETLNDLAEETPIGRLGTPQDVANALLYFADAKSCFITGQVLGVNGGMVI